MVNIHSDLLRSRNATAITYRGQDYSYSDFFDRVDRFSHYLASQGVEAGDRIAISIADRVAYLAAVYGVAQVGAVAVPIPLDDAERAAGVIRSARARLTLRHLPTTTGPIRPGFCREAMIIFTSGTTSQHRKGVILGHDGISTTAAFMNRRMGVDASISECVFAPLDHAFAFGRCHAIFAAGGRVVLGDELNVSWVLSALEDGTVNALSMVPSILALLLSTSSAKLRAAAPRIRWIQTGAMRFDRSFREKLCQCFPDTGIFLHYGLSEAMRVTFLNLHDERHKLHTEGRPADGVEVLIFGDDASPAPPGVEGVIAIRGRNLALGYTDRDLWNDSCRNGWFVTSDRGSIDDDGYLVFAGRSDDVINANGYLVHPDEIESRLHAMINQPFSVVGVADPRGLRDMVIVLCLEGPPTVSLPEVARALSGAPGHMTPQRLIVVPHLPRTPSGKVQRGELARLARTQL